MRKSAKLDRASALRAGKQGFLSKAIAALREGLSLRKAAELAGVAVNTVRKVKELIEDATYK